MKIYVSKNPLIPILFLVVLLLVIALLVFLPLLAVAVALPLAVLGAVRKLLKKKKEIPASEKYPEFNQSEIIEGEYTEVKDKK